MTHTPTPAASPDAHVAEPRPSLPERSERIPAGRYGLSAFLDDQQRMIAGLQADVESRGDVVWLIDGRQRMIHTRLLLGLAASRQGVPPAFVRKYGPRLAAQRWSRFLAVLQYLDQRSGEIAASDLGVEGPTMRIREELIDYLLRCRLPDSRGPIPTYALGAFLDEWGHRWM
jgi:hypothetical protein